MRFLIILFTVSLNLCGVGLHGQDILDSSIDEGFIYVISNKAMPKLIKIGLTKREGPQTRVDELSKQTGVPVPFTVIQITRVTNVNYVEKKIHGIFAKNRNSKKKEFFKIDPEQVKLILDLVVSPEIRASSKAVTPPKKK